MLASIHPLGERARNRRWGLTAAAYVAASVSAAAAVGAVLGSAGAVLRFGLPVSDGATAAVLAALFALGVAVDLRVGGLRVPTVHRQVNDEWLHRYRGWVCGAGFGFQLGLGVVTVVTSATVYLTLAVELLSGSTLAGAAIGTVFGLVRALPVLAAGRVRRPEQLRRLHRRLQAWGPASRRLAVGVQAAVAVLAPAALLRP